MTHGPWRNQEQGHPVFNRTEADRVDLELIVADFDLSRRPENGMDPILPDSEIRGDRALVIGLAGFVTLAAVIALVWSLS